jgi:hypothetical protein
MSWDVKVPFLSEMSFEVFRCLVCRRLVFFPGKGYSVFAGRRYQRGHGLGSIFGGLFKAAMPLLKKGTETLEREALKTRLNIAGDVVQRYCQVHVLFDIVFPQIPNILFLLGVCNNRGKLSYRNDELVSF